MGIMLTVIKKVMPSPKWVAEHVLLSMMQAAGLPAATSEHFSAFYKTHPGLLDSLMTGAGLMTGATRSTGTCWSSLQHRVYGRAP